VTKRFTTNRESCECKMVAAGYDALIAHGRGAFYWDEQDGNVIGICMLLPDGGYCRLPLDGSRGWRWDGNREKPTITPSILQSARDGETGQDIELWHGFMRVGRLESV
jgi:hypothetical protein